MIPERPAGLSARPSRLTSVPKLRAIRALRVAASTPWIRRAVAKPLRITRPRGGGRLATLVDAVAAEVRACPAGFSGRSKPFASSGRPSSARIAKDSASAGRPRTGTSSPPSSMPTRLPRR